MERQSHGFTYEIDIINKMAIQKSTNYTDRWDGYFKDIPISIKTEKLKSDIELADIFRNSEINEDFYLMVGFWEKNKDNIVEEYLLKINKNFWQQQFCADILLKYKMLLEEISNDKEDDEKWTKSITELRNEWKKNTPNFIRPRPKRDHKKQKRVQCAINNKDFYNTFLPKFGIKEI